MPTRLQLKGILFQTMRANHGRWRAWWYRPENVILGITWAQIEECLDDMEASYRADPRAWAKWFPRPQD